MSREIGLQFMNCIEGLMYYCLKSQEINASTVSNIMRLYKHHKKCCDQLEVSSSPDKLLEYFWFIFSIENRL